MFNLKKNPKYIKLSFIVLHLYYLHAVVLFWFILNIVLVFVFVGLFVCLFVFFLLWLEGRGGGVVEKKMYFET